MHDLYRLKENLIKELEELGKQDLSKSTLDSVDKLAHAAKNVAKVIECCEKDEYSNNMDGYSRSMYPMSRGWSYGDMSYADDPASDFVKPDGSYRDGGMSYARGRGRGARRDAMGRYSSAADEMTDGLMKLMDKAPDERTRSEIQRLIERM